MDPVTAFGLAASVAHFVQFSLSILKVCREIRDDAASATKHNSELEETTKSAKEFRKTIATAAVSASTRRISTIAKACDADAEQLIKLLKDVRGGSKASNVFKAMRERRSIEKLEARLRDHEKRLDQVLMQTVHINVEALREQIGRLDLSTKAGLNELHRRMSHVQTDVIAMRGNISADLNAGMNKLEKQALGRHSEVQDSERRRQFLDSLKFAELDSRRRMVKPAAPGTLKWIYKMKPDGEQPRWANLGRWLREDDSIYWISGKAGSGKSTLMASIVDDPRTDDGLREWSKTYEPSKLSFYFWRAGTELQKSITGLLQSLLYQICEICPWTIDAILHDRSNRGVGTVHTWTETSLIEAVETALAAAKQNRFCLFIDGLDEFQGDHDELVNLVFRLQKLDHVKSCVSSRPEITLRTRLEGCKQLRLEDLNEEDITTFVTDKLESVQWPLPRSKSKSWYSDDPTAIARRMIGHLVGGAHGVFLWAALVVQSLLKGIRAGEDLEDLKRRLDDTPRELESLFARMLTEVEDRHKKSLAFYVQVMSLTKSHNDQYRVNSPNICELTAARVQGFITSYDDFASRCKQTRTQILAQSAGLLEIAELDKERGYGEACWFESDKKVLVPELLRGHSGLSSVDFQQRQSVTDCQPEICSELIKYENLWPAWIHRTAFDYVFPPDGSPSPILSYLTDDRDIINSYREGQPKWLAVGPSVGLGGDTTLTTHRLYRFRGNGGEYSIFPSPAEEGWCDARLLDRLHSICFKMHPDDLGDSDLRRYFDGENVIFDASAILLLVWLHFEDHERAVAHIYDTIARDPGNAILITYLAHVLDVEYRGPSFPIQLWLTAVHELVRAIHRGFLLTGERGQPAQTCQQKISQPRIEDFEVGSLQNDIDKPDLYVQGVSCFPLMTGPSLEAYSVPCAYVLLAEAVVRWSSFKRLSALHGYPPKFKWNEVVTSVDNYLDSMLAHSEMSFEIYPPVHIYSLRSYSRETHSHLRLQAAYDLWMNLGVYASVMRTESYTPPAVHLCYCPAGLMEGKYVRQCDPFRFRLREHTVRFLLRRVCHCDGGSTFTNLICGSHEQLMSLQSMILEDISVSEHDIDESTYGLVRTCVEEELLDLFV